MNNIKEDFWNELEKYYPELIQSITDLSQRSYISVTNMENHRTWWSKHAAEFFGLDENYTLMGNEKVKVNVHPDDKEYYRTSFRKKMLGLDLDEAVEYRIETMEGHYDRFIATSHMVRDEEGNNRFLVIHYDNHGIAGAVDPVTGLRTESVFQKDLRNMMEQECPAVYLKIGVSQFSRMNVLYGVEKADEILNIIGQVLLRIRPPKSFVYRLSGAKFALAIKDFSYEDLRVLYKNIVEVMNRLEVNGVTIPLKISGGALKLEPYFRDINAVRSRLTYALNHSKHGHHGELVIFNEEFCQTTNNIELISVIHQSAINSNEGFFLCYQPIVDVETNKIKGMEALIRWQGEPYGVVPPNVFIEWLEEDACIFELGNWILKTALADCKEISKTIPDFFVNVNVCPAQLERKGFKDRVLEILKESGLKPYQLCLEITERCRELDIAFLEQEILFFKSKGIKIALDDFGTGTSSLSVVLGLPFDEAKIDMSFVKGIKEKPINQAMIRAVVKFLNDMDVEACIEGVEDAEVREHLLCYGAKWFQGYYYSKPVPIDEFKKIL